MALSSLQSGITRCALVNAVDINGKFTIIATSKDILKIQRVYGYLLYDSFALSFNPVDKTIIVDINNVNILQAINNNAVAANVYSRSELNNLLSLFDNKDVSQATYSNTSYVYNKTQIYALMAQHEPLFITKADKSNSYTTTEIISFVEPQYTFNGSFLQIVDPITGTDRISFNPNVPINSILTTRIDIPPSSQYGGSIRITPALGTGDASIGYYNSMNTRTTSTGDVWICGVNCDNEQGYSITTPLLNTCFNIGLDGNVNLPYGLSTPGSATNIITTSTSAYLTLATDVVLTFNTNIKKHCTQIIYQF